MDKEELRPILIHEFKTSWTDSAEKVADRILAKIPDDDFEVIASGKVTTKMIDLNAQDWDIPKFDFNKLVKYIDRKVEIGIRVKE